MTTTSFQHGARQPTCWVLAADNMQNSAQLLWDAYQETWRRMEQVDSSSGPVAIPHAAVPHSTLASAVLLLAGLCLENLIKGLRIKQDPTLVDEDRFEKSLMVHHLPRLFDDAGVPLDSGERAFLER